MPPIRFYFITNYYFIFILGLLYITKQEIIEQMTQPNELWDLQFFRKFIPTLVAQLKQVDITFQMTILSLSQFHHRLSSVIVQQPPRFSMLMAQGLFDRIKSIAQEIYNKNKIEMVRLADIVKDFKGALYELSQYFQDHEEITRDAEENMRKIEYQIERLKRNKQQMQTGNMRHECRYYKTESALDIFSVQQTNKEKYLKQRVQVLTKQLQEAKAHLEINCLHQNYVIRTCLENMNKCADKILSYSYKNQRFQTFNRNLNDPVKQGQRESQLSKGQQNRIAEFSDSGSLQKIIQAAEANCEANAYRNHERKPNKILEAAILAQSKDQSQYRSDLQKISKYKVSKNN